MKYASFILNIVLLVAVAVLYYLHFSQATSATEPTKIVQPRSVNGSMPSAAIMPSIFFVNSDTLLELYQFYNQKKGDLEAKGRKLEKEISGRTQTLQYDMQTAQEKAQAGGMTEQQMQEVGMRLRQKEEQLYAYKDEQLQKLSEEERKITSQLNDNISSYLKEYSKEIGADYVFGYTRGGGLLFASDSLDITKSVVQGLNERYQAKNKK